MLTDMLQICGFVAKIGVVGEDRDAPGRIYLGNSATDGALVSICH